MIDIRLFLRRIEWEPTGAGLVAGGMVVLHFIVDRTAGEG
jgi:hypothetical protein